MKKFLFSAIPLLMTFSNMSMAHCYSVPCTSYTTVGPGTITNTTTGNKCFRSSGSGTTVFSSSSTFGTWSYLYFSTKTDCKATINFPVGVGNIYYYGDNKGKVVMNGNDTIKNDGDLDLTLSTTGSSNVIFTNIKVKINGTDYYPGDVYTEGSSSVLITNCSGTVLPLTILKYAGRMVDNKIELIWEVVETTPITVHYSSDGIIWKDISTNAHSPFLVEQIEETNFLRISSIDGTYSPTLIFRLDKVTEKVEIFDLMGNKLTLEPTFGLYFKVVTRGEEVKVHKIQVVKTY